MWRRGVGRVGGGWGREVAGRIGVVGAGVGIGVVAAGRRGGLGGMESLGGMVVVAGREGVSIL